MNEIYLSIGTNLGNKEKNLEKAIELISHNVGEVIKQSSVYITEPWGKHEQPVFYNMVLKVSSILSVREILNLVLNIENERGRVRKEKYGSRMIDIDILFYNDEIITSPDLCVPHPFLQDRNFVLVPLNEIAPQKVHPVYHKTVELLFKQSKDKLRVEKLMYLQ